MLRRMFCAIVFLCSFANADFPYTKQDLLDQSDAISRKFAKDIAAQMPKGYRLRPAIVSAGFRGATPSDGVEIVVRCNDSAKMMMRLVCARSGKQMQILRFTFICPWTREEDSKANARAVDAAELYLKAYMMVMNVDEKEAAMVLEKFARSKRGLARVGGACPIDSGVNGYGIGSSAVAFMVTITPNLEEYNARFPR